MCVMFVSQVGSQKFDPSTTVKNKAMWVITPCMYSGILAVILSDTFEKKIDFFEASGTIIESQSWFGEFNANTDDEKQAKNTHWKIIISAVVNVTSLERPAGNTMALSTHKTKE